MLLLEQARGPLAGSALSPYDKILKTNVNNEHPYVPAALAPALIAELKAAYAVPATKVLWTPWFDRDDPSGNGDGDESLLRHVASGKSCPQPLAAECRRTSDKKDWSEAGQKMICSPAQGAICRNADNGACANYEVRFFCPGPWAAP